MSDFDSQRFLASEAQKQISQFLSFHLSDAHRGESLRKMVAEESDRSSLCDLISQNGVGSFIYFKVKEMDLLGDIPEEFERRLRRSYDRAGYVFVGFVRFYLDSARDCILSAMWRMCLPETMRRVMIEHMCDKLVVRW